MKKALIISLFLFFVSSGHIIAAPNKPNYATTDYVNEQITSAVASINSVINALTLRVEALETAVTGLLTSIDSLDTRTDTLENTVPAYANPEPVSIITHPYISRSQGTYEAIVEPGSHKLLFLNMRIQAGGAYYRVYISQNGTDYSRIDEFYLLNSYNEASKTYVVNAPYYKVELIPSMLSTYGSEVILY